MPPLRVETILTLAATAEENLAQSYERTRPLADKTIDLELVEFVGKEEDSSQFSLLLSSLLGKGWYGESNVDWAPILLSHDLTHTEYGNLLNITDQILKGWSESNLIKYGNFPYSSPFDFPYTQGVMNHLSDYLKDSPLTYNWNTAGFGSWVPFERYNIFALHRTGSLPVSYIVDSIDFASEADTEVAFIEAEDKYWQFFANLRDPNLNRAAQYAALHVIFRKYGVTADREEAKPSLEEYTQRWKALEDETFTALQTAMESADLSESDLEASLEASQCMSIFKWDYLDVWLTNKDSILSEMKKYQASNSSLRDIAKLLMDPQVYLAPFLDAHESKTSELISASSHLDTKIDEFNRDVDDCNAQIRRSGSASSLKCSTIQIEARRSTLEQENARLSELDDEISELEDKIISANNIVNTIPDDVVEVFGDCNKAWRGVVARQADFSSGFVKTPSIVVSRNRENSAETYGGHNLDGRSLKVIPDSSVSRGNFSYDPDLDVLKINPGDTENAGSAARAFERLRQKYIEGSSGYRRMVDNRIRLALNQPIGAVEPVETALARPVPYIKRGRGLGSGGIDIDRSFIGGIPVELSATDVQKYTEMSDAWGGQIIIQQVDSGHQVLYKQKGMFVAVKAETQADFQRAVERAVDLTSRNLVDKKGKVSIISDGSLSWGDVEALHLTANARQAAVAEAGGGGNRNFIDVMRIASDDDGPPRIGKPPTGRGDGGGGDGFFSDGKGSFLQVLSGLNRRNKALLERTDANWATARVLKQNIITRGNGGTVIFKLEVPFKKATFQDKIIMGISSFFKRTPVQEDADVLADVVFKSFADDAPDDTIADRIIDIRQQYKKRVGDDADLRIRLQQGQQDMYLIEIVVDDNTNERV